jgi:hypothetical protein
MKRFCCEFKEIEAVRNDSHILKRIHRGCRELIIQGKPLWVQNRKAFIEYKVCDDCRDRILDWFRLALPCYGYNPEDIKAAIALNSIEIKGWYPRFFIRWLIKRRLK